LVSPPPLGIGVVQLNYGLNVLFDIPGGAERRALIVLSVIIATISVTSGVDKGIVFFPSLTWCWPSG
jgi:choline/glycine/proline betaine transport protein